MLKTFYKIFPLLDHLYIFQLLEYSISDFLSWYIKNPAQRNLQKKHKLIWTPKSELIFLTSLAIIATVTFSSSSLLGNILYFPIMVVLFLQFSPIFLILSKLLLMPIEEYQKNKILVAAKQKINNTGTLKVVAITGSFGKTSTKDILYTLLWKKYRVIKTPKSFNTPLGISQTILEDVKENTDILIAEVGAYKKGEIAKIANLIKPKIAIITSIAPQHLEKFGSIENIAAAKLELVEGLDKSGTAIINKNFLSFLLIPKTSKNIVFYGTWDSMFSASEISVSIDGTRFLMTTPQGKIQIKIPLIGQHHISNFLAAAGAAFELGLSASEIAERALKLLPTPHRLEVIKKPGFTLIDNSFNANLESSKSSFELLHSLPASQKIVITPGLIELGAQSKNANKEFIKRAAKVANKIIIVGNKNKSYLLEGLHEVGFPKDMIEFADSTELALLVLGENIKKDALVLLENDLPDQYR